MKMRMRESGFMITWGPEDWEISQLQVMLKLKYLDEKAYKKLITMISSYDKEMRDLGKVLVETKWQEHVKNIVNNNRKQHESIKLLRNRS